MYTEAKSLAYFISQMNLKKEDDVILLSFKEKMEKMEGIKPQEGWPPYGISESKPQYLWGTPLYLQSGSLCLTLRLESSGSDG